MVAADVVFLGLLLAVVGFLHAFRPETMLYVREWPSLRRGDIEMTTTGRLVWLVLGSVIGSLGLGIAAYGFAV